MSANSQSVFQVSRIKKKILCINTDQVFSRKTYLFTRYLFRKSVYFLSISDSVVNENAK